MIAAGLLGPVRGPWNAIRTFFDAIGPNVYATDTEENPAPNFNMISLLWLIAAFALLLIAFSHDAGRHVESTLASVLYWSGVFLLIVPFTYRIAGQRVARAERLFLLVLMGEAFLVYVHLRSPGYFSGFDEFAHWMSAHDILDRHKLFLDNTLLPVSPFYPALEILTTTVSNLSGLSIFPASMIVLGIARAIFTTSLFLFAERITGSARLAAIVSLVYMASTTYALFNATFSYEALGVVLVVLVMWLEAKISYESISLPRVIWLPIAILGCLAITHHASAMLCVSYLLAVAGIEAVRRGSKIRFAAIAGIAVVAFALVFLWETIPRNPVREYLGSAFEREFGSMLMVLSGKTEAHKPFVSASGSTQPFLVQTIAVSSVLLIVMCLSTGFFRSLTWKLPSTGWRRFVPLLRREWHDSRVLLLTIGAFGFPVSVLFRFSEGWEIGNRMGTWVFISIGIVVAISLVHYWESLSWWRRSLTSLVIATILLGGTILAVGDHPIAGPYMVIADDGSIEQMGIDVASWTKEWLGSGNNFASDRDNQLLLATYGDQNVVTNVNTRTSRAADVSYAFLDKTVDASAIASIKRGRVQYLEVDLRNSTDLPLLGSYFRSGERRGDDRRPVDVRTLMKWNDRQDVSRTFDNGYFVIYNVSRLKEDEQKQQ